MLLKGNLAQKSWPIDAVVGADCKVRGSDFLGWCRGSPICGKLVSILLQRNNDRATIEPRSPRDRATIVHRS